MLRGDPGTRSFSVVYLKAGRVIALGLVAMVLVAAAGLDGIRMMSVLGGFPALFVILGAALSLAAMAVRGRATAAPALPD